VNLRNAALQTLTVFSSLGTLVCCVLPALLVSVGAGAVMASLVSTVPQLVWLSEHKISLFMFAGIMLVLSGASIYRNRYAPCPSDLASMKSCLRLRRFSLSVIYISALIYAVGFFFAFIVGRI
jgi:hypothetical protein